MCKPNLTYYLLLFSSPVKKGFPFLNGWEKSKEKDYFVIQGNYMKFKSQCLSIKFHCHPAKLHSFAHCLWLLVHYNSRSNSNASNIYFLTLCRKGLLAWYIFTLSLPPLLLSPVCQITINSCLHNHRSLFTSLPIFSLPPPPVLYSNLWSLFYTAPRRTAMKTQIASYHHF